ncbi:DUF968 domain-containing protein [Bradyrhizobium manausense]|uniref:DUF968 domain-containing protein n=1 Tax=Bradyrhizobium manausense TaxID=989370 RepID=UPI001BA65A9F|nr:DUF968 domain-containing protein [Bradyrhizobium manausense]MBR1092698.1 DUF968 domain-containing protein [Bradyrhizobium manausense]
MIASGARCHRLGLTRSPSRELNFDINQSQTIMHQSSDHIDTIAAAVARAQAEWLDLTKTSDLTILSSLERDKHLPARQASLAAGFDIVRRTLSRQEIAVIQATRTEQVMGAMYLRTLLAHVSGEWISSDLPIIVDFKTPHQIEPILTGARHYALLSLVGFVVEEDTIGLSDVNAQARASADPTKPQNTNCRQEVTSPPLPHRDCGQDQVLTFPKEIPRKRSKAHLAFVRGQSCLVCQRSPVDAHHLKFAQPSTLGRKVSDEFTVPLCRHHHQALHRSGNERAWWTNLQLDPMPVAKELWATSPAHSGVEETSPVTATVTSVEVQRQ